MFSKLLVLFSCLLFAFSIVAVLIGAGSGGSTYYAVYVGIVTASGAFALTSAVWYYKKAQAENTTHLMMQMHRAETNNRIRYLQEALKLEAEYKVSKEFIQREEMDSPADEFESDQIKRGDQLLNNHVQDSNSLVQREGVS